VVYGASHYATLSAALEHRLGKPMVLPFLEYPRKSELVW
jgi:hypothetical protein